MVYGHTNRHCGSWPMQEMNCQQSINWKLVTLLNKWTRQEVRTVTNCMWTKSTEPMNICRLWQPGTWCLYNRCRNGVVATQMVRRLLWRSTEVVFEHETHLSVMSKCWRWIDKLKLLELAINLSHSSVLDLSLNNPNATKSAAYWMPKQVSNQNEDWQRGHITNQPTVLHSWRWWLFVTCRWRWQWVHHHNPEDKDGIQSTEASYIACNKEF